MFGPGLLNDLLVHVNPLLAFGVLGPPTTGALLKGTKTMSASQAAAAAYVGQFISETVRQAESDPHGMRTLIARARRTLGVDTKANSDQIRDHYRKRWQQLQGPENAKKFEKATCAFIILMNDWMSGAH
jgi:hypothetical protein